MAAGLAASALFAGPAKVGPDGDAEEFGRVFLEAARAGLSVVAYRHGGVPEVVADGVTGLLADEGDVTGLSAALARLLDDAAALWAEMIKSGWRRVEEEFDVRVQTGLLEELYDRVVTRRT